MATLTISPFAKLAPPVQSAYRGPCPILGAHVTRMTHGETTRILCSEYCETEHFCRLRKAALEANVLQGLAESSSESVTFAAIGCVMLRT
jgi:hypothetical protein